MPYETIDHTADTGIRVWAPTRAELFAEACRAMFEQIIDPEQLTPDSSRRINVHGADQTDLLINWLRACLRVWTVDQCLVKSAQVFDVKDTLVAARLLVQAFDPHRHTVFTDIKAVTYHRADLAETAGGWEATVIFDI